jgi:hypothetical protein
MANRADSRAYRTERRDGQRETEITERFADGSIRISRITWAH